MTRIDRLLSGTLVGDLTGGEPRLELTGNSRLLIEDHCGILEYTDSLLRVALRRGQVRVQGEELQLTALTLHELAVSGQIRSVELVEEAQGC